MEVLFIVLIIILLLAGIFRRSNRSSGAWFTSPCPHCRNKIDVKATRCPWCGGEVTMGRWRLGGGH